MPLIERKLSSIPGLKQGLSFARRLLPYALPAAMADLGVIPQMSHPRPEQMSEWLDVAEKGVGEQDLAGRRILIFAMIPHWIDFLAAIGAVLAGRGATVHFSWLPYGYSITQPDARSYVQWMRWRYRRTFAALRTRFTAAELQPSAEADSLDANFIDRVARIDTQYALRMEEIDLSQPRHREVFAFRKRRLAQAYAGIRGAARTFKPDVILTGNGAVLEFAMAWQVGRDLGILPTTVESWEPDRTALASAGRRCIEVNSDPLWKADEPHVLDDARRARVLSVIEQRQGTSWDAYILQCQYASVVAPSQVYEQLGLDRERPIVLVCSNVPWDAMYANNIGLFDTMSGWLRAVMRHLAERTDVQVIVRAHPGELALGTKQTAEQTVRGVFPTLPEHFRFVAPMDKVNTYSLMQVARLGLVFNSTTGLEMAMRGIPVVMPMKAHYAGKGFTIDPPTLEEFFRAIDEHLTPAAPMLTEDQVREAWCYFDLYLHDYPLPFPWHHRALRRDVREWPVERVLSSEGRKQFGQVFDILAGIVGLD